MGVGNDVIGICRREAVIRAVKAPVGIRDQGKVDDVGRAVKSMLDAGMEPCSQPG